MGYGDVLKNAFNVYLFKANAAKALAKDGSAFGLGFATLAIAGVAMAIGTFNVAGIVANPIGMIIGTLIWVGLLQLFAMLFAGKSTYGALWNVLANMSVLAWISVIPILGPILMLPISIWQLIATVFAVREVHSLSTGKAIAVVLIPLAIIFVIAIVLAVVVGMAFLSMMGAMGPGMMQY